MIKFRLITLLCVCLFSTVGFAQSVDTSDTQTTTTSINEAVSPEVEKVKEAGANARNVEKLQVTGSHIRRLQLEGPSPIITIDRERIAKSGFNNVSQVLANSAVAPFGEGADVGTGTAVNLRGIGSARTLVLLNGHRIPKTGDTYRAGIQNVDIIPVASIERIEILKDGASATYGSDALGGVINIITKKDFDGWSVSTKNDVKEVTRGDRNRSSFAYGYHSSKTDFLTSTQVDFTNGINYEDIYRLRAANFGATSTRSNNYSFKTIVDGKETTETAAGPGCKNIQGGRCVEKAVQHYQIKPSYKFSNVTQVSTEVSDDVKLYSNLILSYAKTNAQYQPASFNTPGVGSGITLKASEVNSLGNLKSKASKYKASSGNDLTLNGQVEGIGNWQNITEDYTGGLVVGTKGYFGDSSWEWDVSLNNSYSRLKDQHLNVPLFAPFVANLKNGSYQQYGPNKNVTGVAHNPTSYSVSMINWAEAKTSGDLGDFMGATWSQAFGVAGSHTEYSDERDRKVLNGEAMGLSGAEGSGGRNLGAVYTELGGIFANMLEVQLSARHDAYSDFGSTTNPKLAFRFQPTKWFMLRGSAGTGFQAPTLQDVYGSPIAAFYPVVDEKHCNTLSAEDKKTSNSCNLNYYSSNFLSNPNLKEETSKSFNIGTGFQLTKNLSLNLDYWDVTVNNTIGYDVEGLLKIERQGVDISKYGAQINRQNGTTGEITNMVINPSNQGTEEVTGLDIGFNFKAPTTIGDFTLGFEHTQLFYYFQTFYDELGTQNVLGENGRPNWRNNIALGYSKRNFSGQVMARTIASHEKSFKSFGLIQQHTNYDLALAYKSVFGGGTIKGGVLNLLNDTPNWDESTRSRVNSGLYQQFRTFYVSYEHIF